MKRLVLMASCLLILCAGATIAGAQMWPAGVPGPVPGGPPGVGVPGVGPLQGGPGCGASLCQPYPPCLKPPVLFGSYAAWQVNDDAGKIKFSTEGTSGVIGEETTFIQFNKVNGVWVGGSARVPLGECLYARAESRYLIPSSETATSQTAICATPPLFISRDWSACTKYRWGLIDGAVGVNCAPWLSVMGGLRWDSFYLLMQNPPTIPGFSTIFDESDLTISSIQPYVGFEAAWAGCRSALILRGIGSPWASTRTIFGMTFGGSTPVVRDGMDAVSKRAIFEELSLHYVSSHVTLVQRGGFCNGEFSMESCRRGLYFYWE